MRYVKRNIQRRSGRRAEKRPFSSVSQGRVTGKDIRSDHRRVGPIRISPDRNDTFRMILSGCPPRGRTVDSYGRLSTYEPEHQEQRRPQTRPAAGPDYRREHDQSSHGSGPRTAQKGPEEGPACWPALRSTARNREGLRHAAEGTVSLGRSWRHSL